MTGRLSPLPKTIGVEEGVGRAEENIPGFDAMCDDAPVSRNHSEGCGPVAGTLALANAAIRAW